MHTCSICSLQLLQSGKQHLLSRCAYQPGRIAPSVCLLVHCRADNILCSKHYSITTAQQLHRPKGKGACKVASWRRCPGRHTWSCKHVCISTTQHHTYCMRSVLAGPANIKKALHTSSHFITWHKSAVQSSRFQDSLKTLSAPITCYLHHIALVRWLLLQPTGSISQHLREQLAELSAIIDAGIRCCRSMHICAQQCQEVAVHTIGVR